MTPNAMETNQAATPAKVQWRTPRIQVLYSSEANNALLPGPNDGVLFNS